MKYCRRCRRCCLWLILPLEPAVLELHDAARLDALRSFSAVESPAIAGPAHTDGAAAILPLGRLRGAGECGCGITVASTAVP